MLDFPKSRRLLVDLPLIPLIDVAFILIIFFMLTTGFMRVESMQVLLPGAGSKLPKPDTNLARIYLPDDGQVVYGQQRVDKVELKRTLQLAFTKYPDQRVAVMVAKAVSLQTLVDVMDMVYKAGGKNAYVREWDGTPGPPPEMLPVAAEAKP